MGRCQLLGPRLKYAMGSPQQAGALEQESIMAVLNDDRMARLMAPALLFGLVVGNGNARGASDDLDLVKPPPLAKNIAAMPQIVQPADEAQRRINAALKRLDNAVAVAASDCRKEAEGPAAGDAYWSRNVDVPMSGPSYLSIVITDDAFCGGPHPDTATMSIVYDVRSGRPVDWAKLLPPSLTGKIALAKGMDGTRMATLASPELQKLYLSAYRHSDSGRDAMCVDAVTTGEPPASMVWLDAKQGGMAVQFDLSSAVQNCATPMIIPASVLSAAGADTAMVAAIRAAKK